MSDSKPSVFVINLPSAKARRDTMAARLDALGIRAKWFAAVDGRGDAAARLSEPVDQARIAATYGRITPTEIACALSHLAVYRHMVATNTPSALVLEDDMLLDPDVPDLLTTAPDRGILSQLPPGAPAVVQLTPVKHVHRCRSIPVGHRTLHRVCGPAWYAGAYVLTLEAARRLAETRYPVWTVADHWEAIAREARLSLWCVTPSAAREAPGPSCIAPKHMPRRTSLPCAWQQRVVRGIYRTIVRPVIARRTGEDDD